MSSVDLASCLKQSKADYLSRLNSIATFEGAKAAREEARNLLEGFLYRLQSLLSPEPDNIAVRDFATQKEKDSLSKLLTETFEWLGDNAEKADELTFRKKRADLL